MTRLRIGTRGSPLALAQAETVRAGLLAAGNLAPDAVLIEVISTAGDRIQDRALMEVGGKGLFTTEIEDRLRDGSIDMAVHSMKDMPTELPDGLEICCMLAREDPSDAFMSTRFGRFSELPQDAVVGTASLRRGAQVKRLRGDLEVVTFRGNVQTRLRKLEDGVVDATFLALAGLKRLGLENLATEIMAPGEMLPAVAQGAIGVELRRDNDPVRALLEPLNDAETALCVAAERAFLAVLDGSCRTPIAGHATLGENATVSFDGMILTPDGQTSHRTRRQGAADDAPALCADAGRELKERGGPDFFAGP